MHKCEINTAKTIHNVKYTFMNCPSTDTYEYFDINTEIYYFICHAHLDFFLNITGLSYLTECPNCKLMLVN